jgi:cyclase
VEDAELITRAADAFGAQCVVVAIDARATGDGGFEVVTFGGRRGTGLDAAAWAAEAQSRGAGEILLTSINRDGAKSGYDIPLLRAVTAAVTVPVIASGGAGEAGHLVEAVRDGRASAVLAASIFHWGQVTVAEAKAALADAGLPVRR